MLKPVYFLLLLTVLFSCSKSEPEQNMDEGVNANVGTFTFGEGENYAIFDDGPNIKTQYILKEGQLFEVMFTDDGRMEMEVPLDIEKTNIANEMKNIAIPEFLLQQDKKSMVFGCNACADLKAFYVHVEIDNDKYYWSFDQQIDRLPDELQDYVQKVKETIDAVK